MKKYSTQKLMDRWRVARKTVQQAQQKGLPFTEYRSQKLMLESDIIKYFGPPPEKDEPSELVVLRERVQNLEAQLQQSLEREAWLKRMLEEKLGKS
jgi:hypothetical protein